MTSVTLERNSDASRLALTLRVRDFQRGRGEYVYASHAACRLVGARRIDGTYRRWRIGLGTDDGRQLLHALADSIKTDDVARIDAGVPANISTGGKLSHFRIKQFNRPYPALGALSHELPFDESCLQRHDGTGQ